MESEEDQLMLEIALAESLSLAMDKEEKKGGGGGHVANKPLTAAEKAFFTDEPIAEICKRRAEEEGKSESKLSAAAEAKKKPGSAISSFIGSLFQRNDDKGHSNQPDADSKPTDSKSVCYECLKPIGRGRMVSSGIHTYHPDCFLCARCHQPIQGRFVTDGDSTANYHPSCSQTLVSAPICAGCHRPCGVGQLVGYNGETYHTDCFRCDGCNRPIVGSFILCGSPERPHHADCARELYNPRCTVCSSVLVGSYLKHPFFTDEAYCLSHKNSVQCFSCGRRESSRAPLADLLDGRALCHICSASLIMDSAEAAVVYAEVLQFMRSELGFTVPKYLHDVPILAVDVYSLNEQLSTSLNGHCTDQCTSIVRGCTLSSRQTSVRHIGRGGLQFSPGAGIFGFSPVEYRIESVQEVTAILVLYGLPRDLAGSVLAHEAMHAFIKLSPELFPQDLPRDLEEGLCQVIAYAYLEFLSKSKQGAEENIYEIQRAYFRHQIATDPTSMYGDTFRKVQHCSQTVGLEAVIEYLARYLSLPQV